MSKHIVQALNGEPITLYGDGTQKRSFCCVDDLVAVFGRLLHMPEDFSNRVHIGNPSEFRMIELAETIEVPTESKSGLIHNPLPTHDPKQSCPAINHAKEAMGWAPSIRLADRLEPGVAYFEQMLSS